MTFHNDMIVASDYIKEVEDRLINVSKLQKELK